MSHWQHGKLAVKCTLAVLKRALTNIVPEWEKHIQVDPSGHLSITMRDDWARTYNSGQQEGYSLAIPKGAPGRPNSGLGFKLNPDGTWGITHDYMPDKLRNPDGQLAQEIARIRVIMIAKRNNLQFTESDIGNQHVMELLVPDGMQVAGGNV